MGTESREQTGEAHAPVAASTNTMGNSIHIRARDIGRPAPFTPPEWAKKIPDADFFHKKGRPLHDLRGGYWWIEIGMPWHTIYDNETIRHELTAWALAVWDWIKNHDETTRLPATNYALEWIGQIPGKRESRRIDGIYQLTEHDIQANIVHPDEISYGGWFVDLHTPGGLLAEHSEPAAGEGYVPDSDYAAMSYVGPYGIPLRAHLSADIENLFMAGRCLSSTHAALGTVRVMATAAISGQAVGTAAAFGLERSLPLSRLAEAEQIREIQRRLLRDGVFLPNHRNSDPLDHARSATVTASSQALNYGAGPNDPWSSGGLTYGPMGRGCSLEKTLAQWIAVAGGCLDSVSVCLDNPTDAPQRIRASMVRVDHIWDYRRGLPEIAASEWIVEPGMDQWVVWPVALNAVPDGYVRLDLVGSPEVLWRYSHGVAPGQVAAREMSGKKLRRLGHGLTLAFQVDPPQAVYGPEQAVSGVSRPHRTTNLWRSDPSRPFPHWLELSWPGPVPISRVELTFSGHLLREVHACPPYFRDPQTARDYSIAAWLDGQWTELLVEKNNYQRHRQHALKSPVLTNRLRLFVHATHGDPSGALYEIRAYS
jgi:hypothetical protein